MINQTISEHIEETLELARQAASARANVETKMALQEKIRQKNIDLLGLYRDDLGAEAFVRSSKTIENLMGQNGD